MLNFNGFESQSQGQIVGYNTVIRIKTWNILEIIFFTSVPYWTGQGTNEFETLFYIHFLGYLFTVLFTVPDLSAHNSTRAVFYHVQDAGRTDNQ